MTVFRFSNVCMAAVQPLDTTIGVVTPENIAFEYQLAGPFRRLPAYLIDLAVRWSMILLVGFVIAMLGGTMSVFSTFYGPLSQAIFGAILIFVTFFAPGGIVSALRLVKSKFVRVVPQPPEGVVAVASASEGVEEAAV